MAAKLDHRSRRTPTLSLVLVLISLVICLLFSSFFSVISLVNDSLEYEIGEFRAEQIECSILYSTLQNILIYSSFFVFIILMMMLYKPKAWAYSIPAFLAGGFNLIIGLPMFTNGVKSYFYWFLGIDKFGEIFKYGDLNLFESVKRVFTETIDFLKDCIPTVENPTASEYIPVLTTYILLALPLAIAFCWFALVIAAIIGGISCKIKSKLIKAPFVIISLLFGLAASGVFVISAFSNFIGLINCFFDSNISPLLLGYNNTLSFEGTRYIMLLIAPIMFIGNVLGALGMIMLAIYIVKPNKRGYIPAAEDEFAAGYSEKYGPEETNAQAAEQTADGEQAEPIATAPASNPVLSDDAAALEEAKRIAAYRASKADEAHRAEVYRQEMQRAKARRQAEQQAAIRQQAANRVRSRWSPVFTFSFIALLASLIIEPGLLISTALGIIGIVVMMSAKRKPPIVIMAILNMIFGGGPVAFVAGILMLCIPEDTLI